MIINDTNIEDLSHEIMSIETLLRCDEQFGNKENVAILRKMLAALEFAKAEANMEVYYQQNSIMNKRQNSIQEIVDLRTARDFARYNLYKEIQRK